MKENLEGVVPFMMEKYLTRIQQGDLNKQIP
jgi:hypothetical protein